MTLPVRNPKKRRETISSDLQKLAQAENFALFTLKGMLSNLHHLRTCPSIPPIRIETIAAQIQYAIDSIKSKQDLRKFRKENPNG